MVHLAQNLKERNHFLADGRTNIRLFAILYKGYGTCQPKSKKLLLVLLENAGKVLKGKKGFRKAGKVFKIQESF